MNFNGDLLKYMRIQGEIIEQETPMSESRPTSFDQGQIKCQHTWAWLQWLTPRPI